MYTPQLSMSSFSPSKASPLTQQRPPSPGQQPTGSMIWSDRTLEGHAVLDDDDDDAGNELFDTEADDLFRPDAVDEIEGTIEGEAMIEDDVFETDEDSDNNDDNEEEEEEEEEIMGNEWLNMMRYGSESSSSNSYRSSVAVESTLWRGMMHHLSSVMGLMQRLGVPCQGHQQ
ncbi:hypothetical protein BGZ98_005464 [Dissophora globulifera]|nr:hypothetical protein BGZ98_005464 [Dissophora globulifera]